MTLKNFRPLAVTAVAAAFFFSCSDDRNQEQTTPEEQLVAPSSSEIIQGQYIVVFNKEITGDAGSKYPQNYAKAQEIGRAHV